jgi:mono/diheme cytochrome c family protein
METDAERELSSFPGGRGVLRGWCRKVAALLVLVLAAAAIYLWARFGGDRPVAYDDIAEHFKYGSLGGERESGFPYWIWQALPRLCADKLPGEGYRSLGLLYENGKDLPVGVSKRRVLGMDRVFLNCAVCHTNTVRETPQSEPQLLLGMPANSFDVMGFQSFFFACAQDPRFTPKRVIAEIERIGGEVDVIDRYLVYPLAVFVMQDRIRMLKARFAFAEREAAWGPGRVDTFNFAKAIFNFPMDRIPDKELAGASDFPSIWLQRPRKDAQMQLHWDGNNVKVEERNLSAAFGAGTTPPTIDHAALGRIEEWLLDLAPPSYPFPIDQERAGRGAQVYATYCAGCHGASGRDFHGERVGQVTPIELIRTDRGRLDSYTYELAANQGQLYTGYEAYRFKNFRKTHGYANAPLDGIWLRAPYLHNGSVPTLRDLLEPTARRPKQFYRGYDVYDQARVGFASDVPAEGERRYFLYDTRVAGNGSGGHDGKPYGTELPPADKDALVEYMKTF